MLYSYPCLFDNHAHGTLCVRPSYRSPDERGEDGVCGIVGYVGGSDGSRILIEGLKRLEYRGYDSAGIAMI